MKIRKQNLIALSLAAVMLATTMSVYNPLPAMASTPPPPEYTYEVKNWDSSIVGTNSAAIDDSVPNLFSNAYSNKLFNMADAAESGHPDGVPSLRAGIASAPTPSAGGAFIMPLPYEDVVNNNGLSYPVTEIQGKRSISLVSEGAAGGGRNGSVFFYRKNGSTYYGMHMLFRLDAGGLALINSNRYDGNGSSMYNADTNAYTGAGGNMRAFNAAYLKSLMVDATEAEKDQAVLDFASKTTLSDTERWVDYRLYYGPSNAMLELTLYLDIKQSDETVITKSYTLTYNLGTEGAWTAGHEPFIALGSNYVTTAGVRPPDYYGDFTVKYDTSEYYEVSADLNSDILELSPFTIDEKAQLEGILAQYNAMPSAAQAAVTRIGAVQKALAAFDEGKFFYDDFENESNLSWKIAGRVSGTDLVTGQGDWPGGTDNVVSDPITADDWLAETHTYSEEAVMRGNKTTDATGATHGFWGIHTDLSDVSNKALWLRKSFNPYNLDTRLANNQTRPSVIAITDGILPQDAKITSVSGRMHINETLANQNQVTGIAYQYNNEFSWNVIGINAENRLTGTPPVQLGAHLREVRRTSESAGGNNNNLPVAGGGFIDGDNVLAYQFKRNQWVDFSLDYDFVRMCYVYTVSGISYEGNPTTIKYALTNATTMLSEVGLFHGAVTAPVFDDVSISILNENYADARIADLPDVNDVTLEDEGVIREVQGIVSKLSDTDKSELTLMTRLNDIVAKLEQLIQERDNNLSAGELITFEPGQPGIEYFEMVGGTSDANWSVVNNTNKDIINSSDKALNISRNYAGADNNRATYKLKDSVLPGTKLLSNVSGKVFLKTGTATGGCTTTLIYDYVDEDNWQGFQLSLPNPNPAGSPITTISTYASVNKNGEETIQGLSGSRSAINMETSGTPNYNPSGIWVEFNIEYSLLECHLTLRVYGTDGKVYVGEMRDRRNLRNTCETKFAFNTGAADAQIDDIRVCYVDTPEYTEANIFKNNHKYILNLIPSETFISDIDRPYVTAVKNAFDSLDPKVLPYIPLMKTKVDNIVSALAELDASPDAAGKKTRDQAKLATKNAQSGNYNNYTITDDFEDGLRAFQPIQGINNSGTVTTEYNAEFGSNVLKTTGINVLGIKDILLPDRPQVASVKYRAKLGEPSESYYRLRFYYNYHNYNDFAGLGFHYNAPPPDAPAGTVGTVDYRRSTPPQNTSPRVVDLKWDCIWDIEITYSEIGNYMLEISDPYGNKFIDNGKADLNSLLALSGFGRITYIDDLTVTYRKGNYDTNLTNDDITVYYTANTWVNPGDVAYINGENLAANVAYIEISPVHNGTGDARQYLNRTWFDTQGVQNNEFSQNPSASQPYWDEAKAQTVDIIQKTTNSIKFFIPTKNSDNTPFTNGIYSVRIHPNKAGIETKTIYINSPSIDFTVGSDGEIAAPGTDMRVIGKNIAPDKELTGKMKAVITNTRGNAAYTRQVDITAVQSVYSISVAIPADIPAGEYEIWLYNGYGNHIAWAVPHKFKVGDPIRSSWPDKVFNVRDYGATGSSLQNATPYVINAIAALEKNGGGILYFPEGTYDFDAEIILPQKCRMTGEATNRTILRFRPYNYNINKMPVSFINFTANVEISNLSLWCTRVGGFMRACSSGSSNEYTNPSSGSDNVYIENLFIYSMPFAGSVTDAVQQFGDMTRLMTGAELYALVSAETIHPIIDFAQRKGSNVQIRNVDAVNSFGVRRPVVNEANGSYYWQVDNLKTANGWSEIIISKSLWENSQHGPNACVGIWGDGFYMANTDMFSRTDNNRELYVADRSADYRDKMTPVSDAPDNRFFNLNSRLNASRMRHKDMQVYIADGQGIGQTRMIVNSSEFRNENGVWVSRIELDRPFLIQPNRNSAIIIRRPRENIFFVDNTFTTGSCGGFYGGFADVVYDGTVWTDVDSIYQQGIFNDVNWYLSIINEEVIRGTRPNGYEWQSLSGKYATMGFLQRNCKIDGMYTYLRSNGEDYMSDVIIDNNVWTNTDYVFSFYRNVQGSLYRNVDGILISRNRFDNVGSLFEPLSASVANAAMNTTNSAASKRLIVIDAVDKGNLLGDATLDGVVSLRDATLIGYYVVGMVTLTDGQKEMADVDRNGIVNMRDATLIRMYLVGAINSF